MSGLNLPCVEASGSPSAIGESIGTQLRAEVGAMIDRRMTAAAVYFQQRDRTGLDQMIEAGSACLAMLESWDPDGFEEHAATARAAGVEPGVLYAAANYSDARDLVCVPEQSCSDEGCTSVALPADRVQDGHMVVGQTWDLHPLDVDSVVAVHRMPSEGPETWSVTVAGAPTLIGMNQHGVWVGTTNIKVKGVQIGVCYMSLLHRAIRCGDREEAAGVIQHAPRAAAHTFLLADEGGAIELECTAIRSTRRDLADQPIVRTNHCIDCSHIADEAEPPSASSVARSARAEDLMQRPSLGRDAVRNLMVDREGGLLAINRYPDDGEPTATNACAIGIPKSRHFEACRGPADRGEWVTLPFRSGC